jgi:hypothetical protein
MEVHDYRALNATHVSHTAVIIKPTRYCSVYLFLLLIPKILKETVIAVSLKPSLKLYTL